MEEKRLTPEQKLILATWGLLGIIAASVFFIVVELLAWGGKP